MTVVRGDLPPVGGLFPHRFSRTHLGGDLLHRQFRVRALSRNVRPVRVPQGAARLRSSRRDCAELVRVAHEASKRVRPAKAFVARRVEAHDDLERAGADGPLRPRAGLELVAAQDARERRHGGARQLDCVDHVDVHDLALIVVELQVGSLVSHAGPPLVGQSERPQNHAVVHDRVFHRHRTLWQAQSPHLRVEEARCEVEHPIVVLHVLLHCLAQRGRRVDHPAHRNTQK